MTPWPRRALLAALAAASPAFGQADAYPGDLGVATEKLYHGIVTDEFRRFFERDPERRPPREPRVVVAPADGVVVDLAREKGAWTLVVNLGLTDVHVQRAPLAGRVLSVESHGRGYRGPRDPLRFGNVRRVTRIESEAGIYEVSQITGWLVRRIRVFAQPGQALATGERLGSIMLGSTVTVRLPESVRPQVQLFQRVTAGETVIGRY